MKIHIFIVAIFAIGVCFSQEKKAILFKNVKKTNLTKNTPGTPETGYWLWLLEHDEEKNSELTKQNPSDTATKIALDTRAKVIIYENDSLYGQISFHYKNVLIKYEEGYNSLLIYNPEIQKSENYILTKSSDTITVFPVNLKMNDGIPSQLSFYITDNVFIFKEIYNKKIGLYYTKGEYLEIKKNLLDFLIKLEDAYKAERE